LRGARGLGAGRHAGFGPAPAAEPRAGSAAARFEVCRALAALADPRAADGCAHCCTTRRPPSATRLHRRWPGQPTGRCTAPRPGSRRLRGRRRRGLEALVRCLREAPGDAERAGPALELLARALNDSSPGCAARRSSRAEPPGGRRRPAHAALPPAEPARRRPPRSADRGDRPGPAAVGVDPAPGVLQRPRPAAAAQEAFTAAGGKNKELPPLGDRLFSLSIRTSAPRGRGLIKKHTAPARRCSSRRWPTPTRTCGNWSLGALVGGDDPGGGSTEALVSHHDDVRVALRPGAGPARGRVRRLVPLLAPRWPPPPEPRSASAHGWHWLGGLGGWGGGGESALEGLAELGDPKALAPLVAYAPEQPCLAAATGRPSLVWWRCRTTPTRMGLSRGRRLQPDRRGRLGACSTPTRKVKYHGALGPRLRRRHRWRPPWSSSDAAVQVLSPAQAAGRGLPLLGPAGADQLALFLDATDETRGWPSCS